MNKHTPGPWYAFWNEHFWQINTESEEFPNMSIGNVSESAEIFDKDHKAHSHEEANARVFAAAPDLLTALQGIIAACDSTFDVVALDLDQARAAVAKATQ